jgi:hypothetical protein
MIARYIENGVKALESGLKALESGRKRLLACVATRDARRRVVRLRRQQNVLVAALVGVGILLMVIHWWGGAQARAGRDAGARAARAAQAGPAPAPAPAAVTRNEGGPDH